MGGPEESGIAWSDRVARFTADGGIGGIPQVEDRLPDVAGIFGDCGDPLYGGLLAMSLAFSDLEGSWGLEASGLRHLRMEDPEFSLGSPPTPIIADAVYQPDGGEHRWRRAAGERDKNASRVIQ